MAVCCFLLRDFFTMHWSIVGKSEQPQGWESFDTVSAMLDIWALESRNRVPETGLDGMLKMVESSSCDIDELKKMLNNHGSNARCFDQLQKAIKALDEQAANNCHLHLAAILCATRHQDNAREMLELGAKDAIATYGQYHTNTITTLQVLKRI